jgi:twitching motility two-component system response regulator PilG
MTEPGASERNLHPSLAEGIAAVKSGDLVRARAQLRAAAAYDPLDVRPLLWMARAAETPERALEYLRRAVVTAPTDPRARTALAGLLLREGVSAAKGKARPRAHLLFEELSALTPEDERAWLWRASVATTSAEAISCLTRVLTIVPDHEQARAALERLRERVNGAARSRTYAEPSAAPKPAEPPAAAMPSPAGPQAAPLPPETARSPGPVSQLTVVPGKGEGARSVLASGGSRSASGASPLPLADRPAPAVADRPREVTHASPPESVAGTAHEPAPVVTPFGNILNLSQSAPARQPQAATPARPVGAAPGIDAPGRPAGIPPPPASPRAEVASRPATIHRPPTLEPVAPVLPHAAPAVRSPGAPVVPLAPAADPALGLVLVVDDSPTVARVVGFELRKHRLEVMAASNGREALALLKTHVPDLVLLDINMPDMDGYQVCRAIRADDRTRRIPVVMLSGKDGFFDRVRGRMAGAADYITKPFEPALLVEMIARYFPVRL